MPLAKAQTDRQLLSGPHRYHSRGDRFYGTIYAVEDGRFASGVRHEVEWSMSTTTWLGKIIPKSEYLTRWILKHGEREANRLRDEKAAYGSLLHKVIEDVSLGAAWDSTLDSADKVMDQFRPFRNDKDRRAFRANEQKWISDLNHGIRSWVAFIADKNVAVEHCEIFMTGEVDGNVSSFSTGGTADLACELDFNGKRQKAIVDIKSGGIWPNHKPQLQCYRALLEQYHPEYEGCMLFNWSPNDWRKGPTYKLKNQTPSPDEDLAFRSYVDLAALTLDDKPRPVRIFDSKELMLGDDATVGYRDVSADEIFLDKHLPQDERTPGS